MGIDTKHPEWQSHLDDWKLLLDSYAGERRVKAEGVTYLPATSGMEIDGMSSDAQPGKKAYNAYRTRAAFPDFIKTAVENMVGVMHRDPARIEVPAKLEPMLQDATSEGEPVDALLRRINEAQLLTGRIGLMVEVPDGATVDKAIPFIAAYATTRIINWSTTARERGRQSLEFVVLDETELTRGADFAWETDNKYRLLAISETITGIESGGGNYSVAVFDGANRDIAGAEFIQPAIGGKQLDFIPFVFINATDLVPAIDTPPLLGLANLGMTVYRGEADYRQALFQQGQDTLVIIGANDDGADKETRVGAGATLELPPGADAKYIGTISEGLGELRSALENDKQDAAQKGSQLLNNLGGNAESGDALKIRVAASTANLVSIARTGAAGLEAALRIAAEWVGANPDDVIVEPNLEFAEQSLGGKELLELMQARAMGAPISQQSIHRIMQQRDLTEMNFEEETELIEDESLLGLDEGAAEGGAAAGD